MTRLLIFLLILSILASCSKSEKPTKDGKTIAETELPGKVIFTKNCKLCHGTDGTLGLSGAANLKISALTIDEKIEVITNGRKGMAAWKGQLTPEEIKQVAEYTETLKQ